MKFKLQAIRNAVNPRHACKESNKGAVFIGVKGSLIAYKYCSFFIFTIKTQKQWSDASLKIFYGLFNEQIDRNNRNATFARIPVNQTHNF